MLLLYAVDMADAQDNRQQGKWPDDYRGACRFGQNEYLRYDEYAKPYIAPTVGNPLYKFVPHSANFKKNSW